MAAGQRIDDVTPLSSATPNFGDNGSTLGTAPSIGRKVGGDPNFRVSTLPKASKPVTRSASLKPARAGRKAQTY